VRQRPLLDPFDNGPPATYLGACRLYYKPRAVRRRPSPRRPLPPSSVGRAARSCRLFRSFPRNTGLIRLIEMYRAEGCPACSSGLARHRCVGQEFHGGTIRGSEDNRGRRVAALSRSEVTTRICLTFTRGASVECSRLSWPEDKIDAVPSEFLDFILVSQSGD